MVSPGLSGLLTASSGSVCEGMNVVSARLVYQVQYELEHSEYGQDFKKTSTHLLRFNVARAQPTG